MKGKFQKTMKRAMCYLLVLGMLGASVLPVQAEGETSSGATLIAHYDFENVSGTTVPNTVDADTYAGALRGSTVISDEEGTFGNSLKLGSAAGGMQLTDIINASTTSFTVSMWYKASTTSSSNVNLVQAGEMGGSTGRTILILAPSSKYYTYLTGDNAKTTTTEAVTPTEWQHITFAYDQVNSKAYFYVNGTADKTEGVTLSGTALDTGDMIIGRHRNDNEGQFNGLLDEVRIYEGVIDADTVKAIYEEGSALIEEDKEEEGDTTEPVVLTVDPTAVERIVDDSIFGINHRYAFNGYGTFDSDLMEVKDAFQELYEEAGFGSIRYPGGTISNLFNWKTTLDAVGRKDQIHGFYNYSGQGGIEPNFGIKEIADFADEVDSEIVYVYSLGRGSVQDAEDLIEFLNAEVGTNPNGGIDWAKVRSESGHPEPYNVRYFEIGNEMQQAWAGSDGVGSQGYWLTDVASGSETAYIEGGTATFTKQYAVCEEDWNSAASVSDGSAHMVRYMRYANTNPKKYDANGNIVDDETFVAVVPDSVSVYVGSEQWTIVDSLEKSSATDKHVVVDYSTGALIFGDGVNGAIPASGQQINVSYSVERDGFVDISKAIKETTEAINRANVENGVDVQHEAQVYSSYESQGFITKMANGGYNDWYDGLTIHPYSGTPSGSGETFYDSAMSLAESAGIAKVQSYVNMLPEGKVPVISEYGIFRSTDSLVRSQTHAIYIAKVLMEYVRLGSPYIQKHCLVDWYSSGADALGPTQQAVIQAVAQDGADTKTGEGDFAFFSTPSARVFQMLNSSFGTDILEHSFSREDKLSNGVAAYSALASKDESGNYYAAVVNVDRENSMSLELEVEGIDLTNTDVTLQMLSSESFADENTLDNPDNVAVETTTFVNERNTVVIEIPKHSFMVVKVVAEKNNEVIRLSGDDRYGTAYKAADALKDELGIDKFDAVVVATGKNFADALSGSYLAAVKDAPILLTNGKPANVEALHNYIKDNLNEGGTVYILGGETAVPANVAAIDGYTVTRLEGATRYETNLAILEEAGITGTELIVATGKDFADSLSASAAKKPILLVKPNAALNDDQKAVAEKVAGGKIYVVGGESAVSVSYAEELAAYAEVERVAGANRQETSVKVAETFFADADTVFVANAKNYPDGLCGGPLAAAMNAPMLLTTDGKTTVVADYVAAKGLESGYVLGGVNALLDESVVEVFALESAEEIVLK